jgi:NitT/TauT family transport system ATP-binding protein
MAVEQLERGADAMTAAVPAPATSPVAVPMADYLVLENVAKTFIARGNATVALSATNLTIGQGQFVTLVGPSGCGKSTLLNLVAGLIEASEGNITLGGTPVRGTDRRIGYVTQADNLLPWRTLRDNVAFPLELAGVPVAERRERAEFWMQRVGLAGFGDAYPSELSGGMRQRGNIIRTLIYGPPVILMDEPFGPLDAQTRIVLQDLLLSIWEESRSTVLFVTHDLSEAISLADQVVLMGTKPGRIIRCEEVGIERPRDIFQIHEHPVFRHLYKQIWNDLGAQVKKAVE